MMGRVDMTSPDIHLSCRSLWKIFGVPEGKRISAAEAEAIAADAKPGYVFGARNVSLDIKRGETFVIMGLSGSGKSTLVRCLSRLTEPTSGEILLDGKDLIAASEAELIEIRRHKMGMVFQHFALLPHLTVLENVAFPLKIQGVAKTEREARAQEVVELVGLKGRELRYPRELSGGQQQRVGIARSLAVKPDLWFLDEPFSALDPLIRREMQDELIRLQRMLKKTVVFITHDFDEAIRLADRLAIMKDGVVIQMGTPEEIMARPATDYVSAFTRDAPKAKVLTARMLMKPLKKNSKVTGEVRQDVLAANLAAMVLDHDSICAVVDDAGKRIGGIHSGDLIRILTNSDAGIPTQ
jgi:glycine betaine/proline transport system ATP-binding protein